jgi:S-DNA-T family DNA segregation ATPase FtsK/SpoIIIE
VAATKLNKLKRVSLQQTSVLFFSGISAIVFLSLLTYNRTDCGIFRHDSDCGFTNKAGRVGAYLSEFLFSAFGYLSYLIPVALLIVGVVLFRFPQMANPHNPRGGINAVLAVAGMLAALVAGSGLSTILFPFADLTHSGGGLIGIMAARFARSIFGDYGSTLILLSMFFAGVTLMADIKWGGVVEYIGDKVLDIGQKILGVFDRLSGAGPQVATEGVDNAELKKTKADAENKSVDLKEIGSKGSVMFATAGAGVTGLWNKVQGKWFPSPKKESSDEEPDFLMESAKETVNPHVPQAQKNDIILTNTEDAGLSMSAPSIPKNIQDEVEGKNSPLPETTATEVKAAAIAPTPTPASSAGIIKRTLAKPLNKAVSIPPLSLLDLPPEGQGQYDEEQLAGLADSIVEALGHYGVRGVEVKDKHPGPVVTRFELQLNAGTKVSKVSGLAKDLARNLGVHSVRIVEVIPGKTTIGIEVPNDRREMVTMRSVLESTQFDDAPSALTLALGKDIGGTPVVANLGKMPHLLVAGTTGAGKSVAVNAMLVSMLYKATADEVRLILIDPKMLELSIYEDIPHLLTPVVTDMKNAANALRWCVAEMERRYLLMSKLKVRSLASYNQKIQEAIDAGNPIMDPLHDPSKALDPTPKALDTLPHIVIVVDEFADMMMVVGKKVEELIARIAQKARAAGMHLILATQRPSVDVITGLIKANIPSRIAFNVSTKVDSRTILDQGGAEQLLGQGDMLYLPAGTSVPKRIHGAFVSDEEVEAVVNFVRTQGEPAYMDAVIKDAPSGAGIPGLEPLSAKESETDPLYDEAVVIVTESRRASISYLQRRLKVGYNRAATMIESMEEAGVVSAVQGNGSREVIAPPPVAD